MYRSDSCSGADGRPGRLCVWETDGGEASGADRGGVKEDDPGVGDSAETEEKTLKIGWCSLCEDNDFGISSRESFEREAEKMGWETVVLNNNYDGQTAIENMDTLITMQVDGIINFQVDAGVAEVVAGMAKDAGIES